MSLIVGVLRVGFIGMLAFLNRSHLIESYHVLRKSMPNKMVKCVDRAVLRNIRNTKSRKFDMLQVSLREKSVNVGVQVKLWPAAAVSNSIDKEEFQQMKEINLKLENRLTELEEMIRRVDERQKSRDLKMTQPVTNTQTFSSVKDLTDKVDKLSNYQQSLTEKIEGELMTIGSDVKTIKNCHGMLNTIFHELENKLLSLEKNTEKPMRKYDAIKTRIATLERDVMKNTSHVICMDHSNRSMEWTRSQYFGSAGMFPPDNRCYGEPAAFSAAPSYYDMLPVPRPPAQYFVPPMTPFGPAAPPSAPPVPSEVLPPPPPAPPASSTIFRPLPPTPPKPSAFLPKPPPVTPKSTGLVTGSDKSSSSPVVTPKVEKVYDQIPITTDMLKSVVLKPPDERKGVSKSATI